MTAEPTVLPDAPLTILETWRLTSFIPPVCQTNAQHVPRLRDRDALGRTRTRTAQGASRPARCLPLTGLSQTDEPTWDLGVLTGHETDHDLLRGTTADRPDIWHETTDQKGSAAATRGATNGRYSASVMIFLRCSQLWKLSGGPAGPRCSAAKSLHRTYQVRCPRIGHAPTARRGHPPRARTKKITFELWLRTVGSWTQARQQPPD